MAKKLKLAKGKKTEAAAEAPAKAKKAKKEGTRKFAGKTSGLGVTAFQNALMVKNFKAKLTDVQLAEAMRKEFPEAVAYTTGHVVGIRSAWNNGKRSGQDAAPEKKLPRFNDDGTSTVETRGRGGKKAAAKKETAAAPAKAKPIKKVGKPAPPEPEETEDEGEEEEEE